MTADESEQATLDGRVGCVTICVLEPTEDDEPRDASDCRTLDEFDAE